ncbi:MAG: hypothetical protein ACKVJK_05200 [Methylophagaceae bacterium]|jgi:hypothetical protein|tara:strand:+ start:440 stop:688 length:249 start_codon:yes stop_codon:yes gene_type:complete
MSDEPRIIQPLTPDWETVDPMEQGNLHAQADAKEAWLAENPGLTSFSWELVSDAERDQYMEQAMRDRGFTKTIVNGYVHWNL